MPELPEVEHAARSLRNWLAGAPVARAEAGASAVFRAGGLVRFRRELPGRRLSKVERRGKVLLLSFEGDVGLLSHLGMTGRWVRRDGNAKGRPEHSRARLVLGDGSVLHYCDARMFGRIEVHTASELLALPSVSSLGPDPVLDGIDVARLHGALAKTARPVKVVLMDQAVLAGLGNIYAGEALFRAGIHPQRQARSLTVPEVERLAKGIEAALSRMLEAMGEELPYLSEGAHVPNPFLVYDRAGEPCPNCRRPLEHVTLGGRSSYFCAHCQPLG